VWFFDADDGKASIGGADPGNSPLEMNIEAVRTDARDGNWDAPLSCPYFFDTQNYPATSLAGTVFGIVDEPRLNSPRI
jgi:polyisoprenoid-binding protein YceI